MLYCNAFHPLLFSTISIPTIYSEVLESLKVERVAIKWTVQQNHVQVHTVFIEVQMLLSYCNVVKQWPITTQDLVWVTDNASNA